MSKQSNLSSRPLEIPVAILACLVLVGALIGCRTANNTIVDDTDYFQDYLTQIEYPEIDQASFESAQAALAERPPSVSEFEQLEFQDITLEEAIQMALSNSKVLSRIGGQIVSIPNGAITTLDPAIQESGIGGVERALSAFDARWDTSINFVRNERRFNNAFQQLLGAAATNGANFESAITKTTGWGSSFGIRNIVNYNRNNIQGPDLRGFVFRSTYDMVIRAEYRQALLRGAGTLVNQVAGPNSQPGVYNGVMIARINQDLTLADFETSIRDLIRDVERNYWELYFAYRNLDNLIEAREAARENWVYRNTRKGGIDDQYIEPQARQQYFEFQNQVQNALAGSGPTLGLYGAERELRRLTGLNASSTSILRPSTDPFIAKADFDWASLQTGAMERRVELRRQQWVVKQRELEFMAARNLNRWQLDFIANYGWRGFGDNLLGGNPRFNPGPPLAFTAPGNAYDDLLTGDLNDWNMGFEFGGPIGKRQTFVAVRNAELQLAKSRAVLREQQRQVVLDLNQAFIEVDRAYMGISSNYNSRDASEEEVSIRRKRAGKLDDPFEYLVALRVNANTENAFARAVVDYNIALLNVAYESGQLLSRYNIQIAEGPWMEEAYENAASRDLRFSE